MYDLIIEGRMLVEGMLQEASVCISEGVIADIKRISPGPSSTGEVHRMGRKVLLPGAIDSHVHMRDPGLTRKEDLATGTVSAAFGGVTTVLDMPNTLPPTNDRRSLTDKDAIARDRSYIDYGLYLAVDSGMGQDRAGSFFLDKTQVRPVAMKAFLGESTGSLSFGPVGELGRLGPMASALRVPIAAHAEDGSLFVDKKPPDREKGVLAWHDSSRPASAEASAIGKALGALGRDSTALHVLHVSSARGLDAVGASGATMEVTPHHLLLDIKWCEVNLEKEALCKVNPPLRWTADRAALWAAVGDLRITTLGSDHAPHLLREKEEGGRSPSGIPGVETMFPLMMEKVLERKLSLGRLTELACVNPARRFDLMKKGAIEVGKDADIAVYDTDEHRKVRGEDLHSKCGWTPYEGFTGCFPHRVYSRGDLLIDAEVKCATNGRGRNVTAH